jgi:hypothetical protein
MKKKAMIAGIFTIIAGAWGIFSSAWIVVFLFTMFKPFMRQFGGFGYGISEPLFMAMMRNIYISMAVVFCILGALGIAGGIYALKKKLWGLALSGAIASLITFFPCGIVAVIFITTGQEEFTLLADSTKTGP